MQCITLGCKFSSTQFIKDSLENLIKDKDLVISYVPAFLHIHIAKVCLKFNKHLLTSSYVS